MEKSFNRSFQNAGMNVLGMNQSHQRDNPTPKQYQQVTTNGDYQDKFLITELG